ncbi:MAG: DUF2783 domain-containing protein [Aestuariivita sp.]|nr:DUF2783 domain-containing protein [Aestuariivita sp.]MCY4203276.1 DUF2783 domain-containing protein [Aestuariivita sp.]
MSRVYEDRMSPRQDEFFEALIAAHDGLSESESHALNARIILLLANVVHDIDQIKEVLKVARSYSAS